MLYPLKALFLGTVTLGCFFFFWFGSLLLSWVVLPLVHLFMRRSPRNDRVRACQDIVGHGFRLFIASTRTFGLVDFRPRDVKLDLPDVPFVMIANHPTLIDVTALLAVCPRICCVAKTDLFRSPLVGRLLRYSGYIEGGAVGPLSGAAVIDQARQRLRDGQSVLMFPEGTRSPAHGLKRFKQGVFELSRLAQVPVVPILITCEPPTLWKGLRWYALPKQRAAYNLVQLPTVPPGAFGNDSGSTAVRFQALYQDELDALSATIPPGESTMPATTATLTSRSPGV